MHPNLRLALLWGLLGACPAAVAQAPSQPSLDALFGAAQWPQTRVPTLTLAPPPALGQLFGAARFPQPRNPLLTLTPPVAAPTLEQLFGGAQFPQARSPTLTLSPPQAAPRLEELFGTVQFPQAGSPAVTLTPPAGMPGLAATQGIATQAPVASPTGSPFAVIAAANFPQPQALSIVLVPPPSPFAEVASATFPAPQQPSVVLVPPPSPFALLADVNFPNPQPVSVVLVPGAPRPGIGFIPLIGTVTPDLVLAPGAIPSVQIVQVIQRRGANFFDRNDPTGQASVPLALAQASTTPATPAAPTPPPPPPPPPPSEVCGPVVFADGHGNPMASAPPSGGLSITYNAGMTRVFMGLLPPWDSFGGAADFVVPAPPATTTVPFTIGCPSNASTNGFALRFRRTANPNEVCVTRQALQTTNCSAQGT